MGFLQYYLLAINCNWHTVDTWWRPIVPTQLCGNNGERSFTLQRSLFQAICCIFCVCPAISLVSFNFGRNLFLSRVLEKWEVWELVAKFWNPLRGSVLKLIMRGDAFIFSNLYQDSQVTIMGGDVFLLLNSTLTFTALLCSILLELVFLFVTLLHCMQVRIDRVWWGYVGLLIFSVFGLSYLFWFFVVWYSSLPAPNLQPTANSPDTTPAYPHLTSNLQQTARTLLQPTRT